MLMKLAAGVLKVSKLFRSILLFYILKALYTLDPGSQTRSPPNVFVVCAASDIIKIIQIMAKTTFFVV